MSDHIRRARRGIFLPLCVVIAAVAALIIPGAASAATGGISGTITDSTGADTSATVSAINPSTGDSVDSVNATGAYTLNGLGAGTYLIVARPSGTSGNQTAWYSTGGAVSSQSQASPVTVAASVVSSINVQLPASSTISGTVTDASGNGVGDVTVDVDDAAGSEVSNGTTSDAGDATATSPVGAYSIPDLAPGTYYLYFDTSDATSTTGADENVARQWYGAASGQQSSLLQSNAVAVTVASGKTATASQKLAAGTVISGTVTDQSTSMPISGRVDVYLAGSTIGESDAFAYSEYDGTATSTYGTIPIPQGGYYITGLPAGTYYLDFEDNRFTPSTSSLPQQDADGWYNAGGVVNTQTESAGVTVAAGTPTTANVAVPQAGALSGTVTANGNPQGGIAVTILDSDGQPVDTERTANDGTWADTEALPGTYKVEFGVPDVEDLGDVGGANFGFQYYANATTLANATSVSVTAGHTTTGVNAALTTGGTITGKVINQAEQPVDGTLVLLRDASGNVVDDAATANDGTYTMTGVAAGTYYVEFEPLGVYAAAYQDQYYGGKQVQAGSSQITVTAGQTTANVDAVLLPATTAINPVTVIQQVAAAIPTDSGTVSVSGDVKVGHKLSSKVAGFVSGSSYSYQWYGNGKAIKGATGSTYTITGGYYKHTITVVVTGKKSGYNWGAAASKATAKVAEGSLTDKTPKITGTARYGDTLKVTVGAWTKGTKFKYQWYVNKKAVRGATKSSFKLAKSDEGKTVTIKVTGSLTGFKSVAKSSAATKKVAA